MFEVLGLSFHLYGIILGLSAVLGLWLMTVKAKQSHLSGEDVEKLSLWIVVGGVIGARLYHVLTDWQLYINDWLGVLKVWQGGLSIIGAILGGILTLWLVVKLKKTPLKVAQALDVAAFGLPFAQALGRVGNYVNQELVGLPTTLPWAIQIDEFHRPPGFEQFSTFHPLFAYEALLLLGFGVGLWWFVRHSGRKVGRLGFSKKVGSGEYFWLYALYYCGIRFGLDFLRIEKSNFAGYIGVNQVVLLVIIIILLGFGYYRRKQDAK